MITGCSLPRKVLAVMAGSLPFCAPQTPARSQWCVACDGAGAAAGAPLMISSSLGQRPKGTL